MTREILLQITGIHAESLENGSKEKDAESVEFVVPADYFFKNGKHYFVYDEASRGGKKIVKSKIKINEKEKTVEIMKNGQMGGMLFFEKDRRALTCYSTPFGQVFFDIWTTGLDITIEEDEIFLDIRYTVEVDQRPAIDCHAKICAYSKGNGTKSEELLQKITV